MERKLKNEDADLPVYWFLTIAQQLFRLKYTYYCTGCFYQNSSISRQLSQSITTQVTVIINVLSTEFFRE